MFSDDSLDEFEANENIEYLNEFDNSPLESPIASPVPQDYSPVNYSPGFINQKNQENSKIQKFGTYRQPKFEIDQFSKLLNNPRKHTVPKISRKEKSQDLHEISLNELDEINELSASSQNLNITLEKPEIPIRRDVYPERKAEIDKSRLYNPSSKVDFINKVTGIQKLNKQDSQETLTAQPARYNYEREFEKLKLKEERIKNQKEKKIISRISKSKSASSYLDKYINQPSKADTIQKIKSAKESGRAQIQDQLKLKEQTKRISKKASFDILKWKSPEFRNFYLSSPESSKNNQIRNEDQNENYFSKSSHDINSSIEYDLIVGDSPLRQIHNNGDIPYFELSPTSRNPQANQIQNTHGKYEELNRTRDIIENQAKNRRIEIKENSTYSQGYFSNLQAQQQRSNKPNYKPYNFKEYQNLQKIDKPGNRGGLGAERASEAEMEKLKRKSDYAEQIRQQHRQNIKINQKTKTKQEEHKAVLAKKHEQRRKVLAFAATVPKPVVRKKAEVDSRTHKRESRNMSKDNSELDLDRLLARHKSEQARIQRLGQLANIN